jgi:hypothetical protein
MTGLYRSGQAAKMWGISAHLVRRACEAGLIEAERTVGGQWKIPHSEVERVKKEGMPEIPSSIEPDQNHYEASSSWESSLPSFARQPAVPLQAVVAETRQNRLKIDPDLTGPQSWFDEFPRAEVGTSFRHAEGTGDTEQGRIDWHDSWMVTALRSVPSDAPPEIRLVVRDTVADALQNLGPQHSWGVIDPLVRAAVAKALRPWGQERETERAIEAACTFLPWAAKNSLSPTSWESRAKESAAVAVRKLPMQSAFAEKLRVGSAAVQQVATEFQDHELRKTILNGANLWDISPEEREEAQGAIRRKLECLPAGASALSMQSARERSLVPFRESKKRREKIGLALARIRPYLGQLRQEGEVEFDSDWEVWGFARRLESQLRPLLEQELLNDEMSDRELSEFVEELVNDVLDEEEMDG